MAMNIKQPAIDGAIAIGGGTLIKTQVIERFATVNDLFANIQFDLMGIDIKLLVAGIAALVLYKTYMK